MKKKLGNLSVAVLLGVLWPFVVGANDTPTLRGSVQWLTLLVDQLRLPDVDFAILALAMVMLAAQYLAVAGLAALLQPLGRAVLDFISAQWLGRRVNFGRSSRSIGPTTG